MISYKGYLIKPHSKFQASHVIVTEGRGGKIPKMLEGMFTSVGVARSLIDKYTSIKPVTKEKNNADKTIAKSGD